MANSKGMTFVLATLCVVCLQAQTAPPLPKLPIGTFSPTMREQIQAAYQAALEHPNEADTNGRLGMFLYAYELYEFADPCFERARAFSPKDLRWTYYLGRTRANLGKYDQAVANLQEALHQDPNYLPARLKLAECLIETGNPAESLKIYEAILEEYPAEASAHYGLGRIYATRREFAPAIEHLRKACELFPGFGAAHFALARAYRDAGEPAKAQEELSLYQEDKLGWPTTPDRLLSAVLELKSDATAHLRKGIDLAEAGQLQEAVKEHELALSGDPKLVLAHIHLIKLYGMLGQPEKAEEHYRSALALDPNLPEIHYNYGVLLTGQKRYQEAEQAFRRALEANPSYADAHNNYAYLLMIGGHLEEAAEQYRAAIADKPDYRAAHFNLGRILVQQGNLQEAIAHFLKTLTPEDQETPRCLYALGAAYARAGNREDALRYMREARDKATTYGQSELLEPIEKDLRALEQRANPQ
ncbi:MAG TPA: tetratricopeptide repeat protein [Acidobacteriota bacterium]|nr:tetratricopeptide repeat protein [Acidobacteriota bacterium]